MGKEKSTGCVVFREEDGKRYYLLLEAKRLTKGTFWDFPKGHMNKNETEEETALRETKEETGLSVSIIPGFRTTIKYSFKKKIVVNKEVIFFLGKAPNKKTKISFEHVSYKWLEYSAAIKQLTFKNSRNVLEQAEKFLSAKIKAVVFDWNGVITDSLKLDHEIFLKECMRKKLTVPKSVRFYSNMFDDNVYVCLKRIGFEVDDEGESIYRQLYLAGIDQTKPFEGVKEMLETLGEKYKLAIITSNYAVAVKTFFRNHGMDKLFDLVMGSETSRRKEEKIKILLDKLSLKKEEIIYVGDTVSDIKACHSAGIKIIAVTWGYQNRSKLAKFNPDYIVDEPKEILNILNKV